MPVKEYINTVEYTNYPSSFLVVSHCGNFDFNVSPKGKNGIYVVALGNEEQNKYLSMGYSVKNYGNVGVVYK